MTPRTFAALAVAAVISVAAAVVAVGANSPTGAVKQAGEPVVAGLLNHVNDVAAIIVEQDGDRVTLQRNGESWSLKERDDYPVKREAVRTALIGLARLTKLEPKTALAAKYSLLDLGDPDKQGAKSKRVTLLDGSGKKLANLIIGRENRSLMGEGEPGTYIRYPDDPQTWLARGAVDVPVEVHSWVKRTLVDVDSSRVSRVIIHHPDGKTLTLVKAAPTDKDFTLPNIPDGKRLKKSADTDYTATSLAHLELDDVQRDPGADAANLEKFLTVDLQTFDGLTVTADLFKDKKTKKYWARLDAKAVKAPTTAAKPAATAAPDKAGAKAPDAKAPAKIDPAADAKAITGPTHGWIYELPDFKVDAVNKTDADFLEDVKAGS